MLCVSNSDSTNYLDIGARSTYNASYYINASDNINPSDYINASILAVSAHVINSIEVHLAHARVLKIFILWYA